MKQDAKIKRFRLRIALPVLFTLLLSITGTTIFLINFYVSIRSTQSIAEDYLASSGSRLMEKTINYLQPAAKVAEFNSSIASADLTGEDFFIEIASSEITQFANFAWIALIYFASIEGDFWLNGVHKDKGTIATQVVSRVLDETSTGVSYQDAVDLQQAMYKLSKDDPVRAGNKEQLDQISSELLETVVHVRDESGNVLLRERRDRYSYYPTTRGWFRTSQQQSGASWSGVYTFSDSGYFDVSGKPGITVSYPVTGRDGRLVGVSGVDIVIGQLQNFLDELKITPNGRSFILNENGQLIAMGNFRFEKGAIPDYFLGHIKAQSEGGDSVVAASYADLREHFLHKGGIPFSKPLEFSFDNGGQKYLNYYARIPQGHGPAWTLGLVVPENDFIGEYKKGFALTVIFSLLVLILLILLALYIGHRITYPLQLLTREVELIQKFDLEDRPLPQSNFIEITNISNAIGRMKNSLKSFEKYIPSDVVHYLVSSGNEAVLGGHSANLTIMFTDLVDFTSISEQLTPEQLVNHLGMYLGTFSGIIKQTGGTVDKYIGDAVMAFWNAPNSVENHAVKSCGAALSCQRSLAELNEVWKANNQPLLFARIGVHTGDVIVGNMGSQSRLNYTVIGDAVNLASRLEGLGKIYGVPVLVSETTYKLARHVYDFRKLDRVTVKGKTIPVTIYELLDEKGKLHQEKSKGVNLFERGLEAYFTQEWDAAGAYFRKAAEKMPGDQSCSLFLDRVEKFKRVPPDREWHGIVNYG